MLSENDGYIMGTIEGFTQDYWDLIASNLDNNWDFST